MGGPEVESPDSMPLGHIRSAVVTAPGMTQTLNPMDALVPAEL